ncbi:hypothetical protein RJ639_041008 [Escallonia herrerae]|uniref:Peptide transporter 1 n=1 Tax=Escallonia herrerae TaxID=1293975 RepID=A0AA88WIL1_9ASTE|nr:hypothetical protein RJ639_041008 [Escallonia herrerae]
MEEDNASNKDRTVETLEEDDIYTKDGTVDSCGNPANKKKTGTWKACPFILGNECCERLAYYGMSTNLLLYFKHHLNQHSTVASKNLSNWSGTCYITPLIGAFVADAYLGRYWTIASFSIIYVMGMTLLTLSASVPGLKPSCYGKDNCHPTDAQSAVCFTALYLVALGTGGIKPCVSSFGADQFDDADDVERKRKSSFFNWFYFSINIGALIASSVLVWIQDNVGWGWGFGIPAVTMAIAVVSFFSGTRLYRNQKPAGSPLTRLCQVVVASLRKRRVAVPADKSLLYEVTDAGSAIVGSRKLDHTKDLSFFDKAAVKKQSDNVKGSINPWRLCTVTQVEELKAIIRLLPIWATGIIFATVYGQMSNLFVLQGSFMDIRVVSSSSFEIPPAALSIFDTLSVIFWVPIYDKIIVPVARKYTGHKTGLTTLQRMGIGLFISIFAMLSAGILEVVRLGIVRRNNYYTLANMPMSIFWQVPQYFLIGCAEVFTFIGQLEFFYQEAPDSMRSLCSALSLTTVALGNYLSSLLVTIVTDISTKDGKLGWIPDNLNYEDNASNKDRTVETLEEDDIYTKDGTVDCCGNPANKKKTGTWKACPFILGNECCERLAYYGMSTNLLLYFKHHLNQHSTVASKNLSNWSGTCYITPLIGAFVADAYLGRYWTIASFSIIYVMGMTLLTLSASVPGLKPSCYGKDNCHPTDAQSAVCFTALYLVALGTGGIKPCVSSFGADQFDDADDVERKRKSSFFNWFYFSINIGALIASSVLVWIQDNVGWGWGFGIPAVTMAIAVVSFFSGTRLYRNQKPAGSPLTRLCQVVVASLRKRRVAVPADKSLLYEVTDAGSAIVGSRKLNHTKDLSFFDKAAVKKQSDNVKGSINPWRLCTVTQVEELKAIKRLLPIWATGIIFATVQGQMSNLFVLQGSFMDIRVVSSSSFEIPPAALSIFDPLSVIFWVPIYDKIIVPVARKYTGHKTGLTTLQRMGIGLFISIFAMLSAGILEVVRLGIVRRNNYYTLANMPMSIFWQVPQYFVIGCAEVFTFIGQLEFFYQEAPDSMRSLCSALSLTTVALGNYLSSLLVTIATDISTKDGKLGWIPDNLNYGHLHYFFWASVSPLLLLLYLKLILFASNVMNSGMYRVPNMNKSGKEDYTGSSIRPLLDPIDEDDIYTKDETIDYLGNPANKLKTGTWKACRYILGNECCERLAQYGMASNLMLYFKNHLNQHSATASRNLSNWSGTCYITPLIGAFIADAYLGRYWTIASFSMIYVAVSLSCFRYELLTLSATVSGLKPTCYEKDVCSATDAQSAVCFTALYLVALGTGGIKPCVSSYGADQFDDDDEVEKKYKTSFFNWFYFSINIGALVAHSLLVWIQDNVGRGWGFGIPAVTMAIAVVFFFSGTQLYRNQEPRGSPLTRLCQVVVASFRKRRVDIPAHSAHFYKGADSESTDVGTRKLDHTEELSFFDKAAVEIESDHIKGSIDPWMLCTVTQVEELKAVIRLLYWNHVQHCVWSNEQFIRVTRLHYGSSCGSHCCQKTYWSEKWLDSTSANGHRPFISIFAMLSAGVLEVIRLEIVRRHNYYELKYVPMSIFWQVPQYFLIGCAEVFTFVGQLEFFYDQAPDSMRSLCSALSLTTSALGGYLSSLLVTIVAQVSTRYVQPGWIPDNLNYGHLQYFFWLLAMPSMLN